MNYRLSSVFFESIEKEVVSCFRELGLRLRRRFRVNFRGGGVGVWVVGVSVGGFWEEVRSRGEFWREGGSLLFYGRIFRMCRIGFLFFVKWLFF